MDLLEQMQSAQELLQKAGVGQWELAASDSRSLSIAVRDGQVDKFQESRSQGLSIRVCQDGRPGFAYIMGPQADSLNRAMDQALSAAAAADVDEHFALAEPGGDYAEVDVFDPALAEESTEDKLERARALLRAAQEFDPRVTHVHPAQVGEGESWFYLRNSRGLDLARRATRVSASAVAIAAEGDDQEMDGESDSKRFVAELDVERIGREAARRATACLGGAPVADGRYPVILENRVAAEFLELLAQSLMGDNLVKGRSFLARLQGKQGLGPLITIIDDGLYPRGLGTSSFDGEGTPAATKTLVDQGVVRGFLFDLAWASRAGQATTGNAVRGSLKAPPGVGMSNLYLQPGQGTLDQLAAGLDRGLVISDVMGVHTADPVSGEFSLGASGCLVEGGRITRPVKSIALAGDLLGLFNAVEAVGGDLRFFGSLGCPSLLVSGLSISGG